MYSTRRSSRTQKSKTSSNVLILNIHLLKLFFQLFQTHATQREHEKLKKKTELEQESRNKKSKADLEVEKRDEGLQKSLDFTNKGFAMLAKMGYIAGESLGKSKSGRVEPIPIEVKNDRGGLGMFKQCENGRNLLFILLTKNS